MACFAVVVATSTVPAGTNRIVKPIVERCAPAARSRQPLPRQPSSSFFRRCTTSRIGGAPNSRLYSRLNCDALS
ncbi:hypothetical protein L2Y90_18490 [Burkholderia pyrrocinia]|nr:hypothetical protein L2Y90_18490 [Burkholderia pyrrocinia]